LQKLYTISGNVYPLWAISESVKTVIADLPIPERGQDGRACYYDVLSGATACLQEGWGLQGDCLVAPRARTAPSPHFLPLGLILVINPTAQSWGNYARMFRGAAAGVRTAHQVPLTATTHSSSLPTLPQAREIWHFPSWLPCWKAPGA
jgi:hypothetical protein